MRDDIQIARKVYEDLEKLKESLFRDYWDRIIKDIYASFFKQEPDISEVKKVAAKYIKETV